MELGDIFGVRFEGERNFGSTKVKNAPRSDLALSKNQTKLTTRMSKLTKLWDLKLLVP